MSKLNIISYNVNSIKGHDRIHSFLVEIERLKADILFLVDTRLNATQNRYLMNNINDYKVFSNVVGDLAARGVSILIKRSLNLEVLDRDMDTNGNFIMLKVKFDN